MTTDISANPSTPRKATLFTDPPLLKPPIWSAPLRAIWPIAAGIVFALFINSFLAPRLGGYGSELLIYCGINIIMAVSLTVVNGFTGQFSIGHAGFMSLGGYVAAGIVYYGSFRIYGDFNCHGGTLSGNSGETATHLLASGDLLFVGACISGAIFAAVCGWIVGLPSLRLRGDYLAIVTLGFGEIVRVLMQGTSEQLDTTSSDPSLTDLSFPRLMTHLGGALGLSGQPVYSTPFWVWLAAGITLVLTIRLKYSSYGRALISIREDDVASQAVGVNITKLKVRAFVYAAFFAGLGGGLYAMKIGSTINAGDFGFQRSFDFVIMVVLGGLGSVSGAAMAAIILTLLPELLRDPPGLWPWGFVGAIVIATMIFAFATKRRGPLLTLIGLCLGWETIRWLAHRLHIDLPQYRMVIYALALIVMMIVRPQGLFGIHEIWDYLPRRWHWWNRRARTLGAM